MLFLVALLLFSGNLEGAHAATSTTPTTVPNESLVATGTFKDNTQVQLTRKANPNTGEGFYTLYLLNSNTKGLTVLKPQNTTFHFTTLHHPNPVRFEISDANKDGREELFVLLQDDAGITYAALLSWSGTKLNLLHQTTCTELTYSEGNLRYTAYNFDSGFETKQAYNLSAKGSLTRDKTQCYEMGIRVGLSYDDFKDLLGSSAKKQYLKTHSDDISSAKRRFLIKNSHGEFIFEGPKLENGNTPYTLVEMTYTAKGLRTIGGIAPGDRVDALKTWLEHTQQESHPLLSSNFLANELLVKTKAAIVGGQTEVWHFKHLNGIITEIHCELE